MSRFSYLILLFHTLLCPPINAIEIKAVIKFWVNKKETIPARKTAMIEMMRTIGKMPCRLEALLGSKLMIKI
jgi:hypothetical protein